MSTQTSGNLQLTKPAYGEKQDVAVFNSNMDIIDANVTNNKNAINGYIYGGALANNTNLNDVTTPGTYQLLSTHTFTNMPERVIYTLIVMKGTASTTEVLQLGFSYTDVYFRFKTSSTTWGTWKNITLSRGWYHDGNVDDLITPGVYGLSSEYTYTGLPTGITSGLLEVLGPSITGTYAVQRLTSLGGTYVWMRYRGSSSGTVWGPWRQMEEVRTLSPTWDTTKVDTSANGTYLSVKRCGRVVRVGGGFVANAEIGLSDVTIATGFPKSLDRITGSIVAMNTTTNKPLSLAINVDGELHTYYSGEAVASGQAVRFNVTYFTNDP